MIIVTKERDFLLKCTTLPAGEFLHFCKDILFGKLVKGIRGYQITERNYDDDGEQGKATAYLDLYSCHRL